MKTNNESTIDKLIKNSFAALKTGDKSAARELALKAAEISPESEQAWLILASLSESEQALQYLENALRANPDSKAARKGIRLVSSQIKPKDSKKPTISSNQLDDTSRIPVLIQEDKKPAAEIPDQKETQLFSGKKTRENGTLTKKEAFRKKLAKKSKTIEKQAQPSKGKKPADFKKSVRANAAAVKDIPDKKPQKVESIGKQRSADLFTARPKDIKQPLINTKKKSKKTDEISSEQFPVWNVFSQRNGKTQEEETYSKAAAPTKMKVEKEALPARKSRKAKKNIKKNTEMSAQDVDIIELVLVSLAAILLPLLAFLYFFLKK